MFVEEVTEVILSDWSMVGVSGGRVDRRGEWSSKFFIVILNFPSPLAFAVGYGGFDFPPALPVKERGGMKLNCPPVGLGGGGYWKNKWRKGEQPGI